MLKYYLSHFSRWMLQCVYVVCLTTVWKKINAIRLMTEGFNVSNELLSDWYYSWSVMRMVEAFQIFHILNLISTNHNLYNFYDFPIMKLKYKFKKFKNLIFLTFQYAFDFPSWEINIIFETTTTGSHYELQPKIPSLDSDDAGVIEILCYRM